MQRDAAATMASYLDGQSRDDAQQQSQPQITPRALSEQQISAAAQMYTVEVWPAHTALLENITTRMPWSCTMHRA